MTSFMLIQYSASTKTGKQYYYSMVIVLLTERKRTLEKIIKILFAYCMYYRCEMEVILLEIDRILRPQGSVIIRDDVDVLVNVKSIVDELQWESRLVDHEGGPHVREKLLIAIKQYWTAPDSASSASHEHQP